MSDDLTFGVKISGTGSSSLVEEASTSKKSLDDLKQSAEGLNNDYAELNKQSMAAGQAWLQGNAAADAARDKAWALANGYKEVNGQLLNAAGIARQAAGATDEVAFASHRAYTEMVVLAREAARGNFSRMAGSATILAQGLSPLGLAIAGVTALVAGGIYVWEKYGQSLTDIHEQLNSVADDDFQKLNVKISEQTTLLENRLRVSNRSGLTGLSSDEANKLGILSQAIDIYTFRLQHAKEGTDEYTEATNGLSASIEKYNSLANQIAKNKNLDDQVKAVNNQQKNNEKTISDAQHFEQQLLDVHETAFQKHVEEYQVMEDKLLKIGQAGDAARMALDKAMGKYISEEQASEEKNAADKAAKAEKAKAAHLAAMEASQSTYYAKLKAEADGWGKTADQQLTLRYNKDLVSLEAENKKMVKAIGDDHAAQLKQTQAFEQAKADLRQYYRDQEIAAIPVVGAMELAFIQQNQALEFSTTLQFLTNLSAVNAGHSRTMFNVNKIAAESQAIISTYSAANKALDEGGGGPLGWAMAAAAIAMGMANVAAIQSTQFGGGGAASGGGGVPSLSTSPGIPVSQQPAASTTAPALAPAAQAPQQFNLTIVGAKNNPDQAVISYNTLVTQIGPMLQKATSLGAIKLNIVAA